MSVIAHRVTVTALLLGLLSGCTSAPIAHESAAVAVAPQPKAAAVNPVPELNLNLPSGKGCQCAAKNREGVFLDRGFVALATGDYSEAKQYYERHQRVENSDAADWEAKVATGYLSILPDSGYFDPEEAANIYRRYTRKLDEESLQVDEKTLWMLQAMGMYGVMEKRIADLEKSEAGLREDLAKRDEAIKRLRELTLGQRAAKP